MDGKYKHCSLMYAIWDTLQAKWAAGALRTIANERELAHTSGRFVGHMQCELLVLQGPCLACNKIYCVSKGACTHFCLTICLQYKPSDEQPTRKNVQEHKPQPAIVMSYKEGEQCLTREGTMPCKERAPCSTSVPVRKPGTLRAKLN